ncbi:Spo0B domain-containing protein [Tepidibacter formicigenes]|uniref:Sensor_kinase_SpoOB-type, alpha-helical domain n=1 Tax=Tepidibacter formicigenes DSM 15518 TaxID=1123349 RepID=A0A1M6JYR4_9FIRM|nr:Spo0B domain-containing protein [Tepidibacter formicigenes]SHJ51824.1 Sensor_kinase_SpoOB-type, alpha-helical domain [Tepidibacter formicigenes DSM 15518]
MKKVNEIDLYYWDLIEELLREQRHDFLNEIQIIFGYIKLNKIDKAVEYINKVSNNARICSKLSNLNCLDLCLMLNEKFNKCKDLDINIDFEVYSVGEKSEFLNKNIKEAIVFFEKAVDIILGFMYNNPNFEEYIFYIEETSENFILKVDLNYFSDIEQLRKKLDLSYGEVILDEDYLIYEIELN